VKKGIEIVPVSHVDEVLRFALVKELEAIDWTEPPEADTPPAAKTDGEAGVVTH
jgi:ATP-dependent Lon protease